MSFQNILIDRPEPSIHLLSVNRPKELNAVPLAELAQAIEQVAADDATRALLVTGS